MPYEKLSKELAQYDYGVHTVKNDFAQKAINDFYTKEKRIYAAINHFFDYLDAGLPIISAIPVKFIKHFESAGVLVNWTIEQYNFEELMRRRDEYEYRKNVINVRNELCINNRIEDLIEFYKSLIDSEGKNENIKC